MWAILGNDNETVIDGIPPSYTEEQAIELAQGRTLVTVTYENGPAYVKGKWNGVKFLPPEEWRNLEQFKHLFGDENG